MKPSILQDKIVLIVDDYQINREFFSLIVSDTGAIPLTASNGKECIDIIIKQQVEMVLMDNRMPVMDGIEATKVIRTLPQGKDIVIIGISGSVESDESDTCIKAGMNLVTEKLTFNKTKLNELAGLFFSGPGDSNGLHVTSDAFTEKSNTELKENDSDHGIMDYEKALRGFENDNDLLVSLIEEFNKIVHSQLIVMRQALDMSDFECIRNESHGIKGGAANLCALPLSEAAKSIETACKQNAEAEVISGLIDEFACVLDSFDKYVQTRIISKTDQY
jgi:two-component system sensor histidine kinase/response regulator